MKGDWCFFVVILRLYPHTRYPLYRVQNQYHCITIIKLLSCVWVFLYRTRDLVTWHTPAVAGKLRGERVHTERILTRIIELVNSLYWLLVFVKYCMCLHPCLPSIPIWTALSIWLTSSNFSLLAQSNRNGRSLRYARVEYCLCWWISHARVSASFFYIIPIWRSLGPMRNQHFCSQWTKHSELKAWITKHYAKFKPEKLHLVTGTEEENQKLVSLEAYSDTRSISTACVSAVHDRFLFTS